MYIKLFASISAIFFLFCSCNAPSERWKAAEKIIQHHSNEFRKSDSMMLFAVGEGSTRLENAYKINIDYWVNRQVDIDEARRIYFRALDRAVELLNESEGIRPYLTYYPANETNVHMMVAFSKSPGVRPDPGYVALVNIAKGRVFYDGYKDNAYYDLHSETIPEARQRIREY